MDNMDVMDINTLGDLIRFHREKKDFSFDELSRKTKIQIHQLINLEKNKLQELPSRVYLVGFLKALCAELEINLELALHFLNESNIKESVLELLPQEQVQEIKPLHIRYLKKITDNKVLMAAIITCSLTIVVSLELAKNRVVIYQSLKEEVPATISIVQNKTLEQINATAPQVLENEVSTHPVVDTVAVKQAAPVISNPPVASSREIPLAAKLQIVETSAPTAPVVQQLTITAKKGTAFIVYRVDNNPLVKFFLKPGKVLELKGEQIRLDAGNPDVLEISRNGEPLTIEKNIRNPKFHLVFPEVAEAQTKKL